MRRFALSGLAAACLLGAPAAARAEAITLVCEEEAAGMTWTARLDYAAGTMSLDENPPVPVSITAEAIRFSMRREPRPSPGGGWYVGASMEGGINRLAGTLDMQHCMISHSAGTYVCRAAHARCRQATQKF